MRALGRLKGSLALLAASSSVALLSGEAVLRLVEGEPLGGLALRPAGARPSRAPHVTLEEAAAAARKIPLASGVEPAWFLDSPPPYSGRGPVPPQLEALLAEAQGAPVGAFELAKAWNRSFVLAELCSAGEGYFADFPERFYVFEPARRGAHPRYRYLPSATTPAGLVTNRFGLRGEEVALRKPERTVRVAFLGASTTVESHGFAHAYPDFVGHWLNLWARAHGHDVRFETLNAGREGFDSPDIAALVREELAPLEPDLIVYHEGSNQFSFRDWIEGADALADPRGRGERWWDEEPWLVGHSALARRVHAALGGTARGEPDKPDYGIRWPGCLDEAAPDPSCRPLPLGLPAVLRDLDAIARVADRVGALLVPTSFVWMVWEGMLLDPLEDPNADSQFDYLNRGMWPYRYRDVRRMADFQNQVLRRHAELRGLPFLDVHGAMPRETRFFFDPIHTLPEGSRLRAWIVLQGLVPLIETRLAAGRLPRPARTAGESHPVLEVSGTSKRELRRACGREAAPEQAGALVRLQLADFDWRSEAGGVRLEHAPRGLTVESRGGACVPLVSAIVPTSELDRLVVDFTVRSDSGGLLLSVRDGAERWLAAQPLDEPRSQGRLELDLSGDETVRIVVSAACPGPPAGSSIRIARLSVEGFGPPP